MKKILNNLNSLYIILTALLLVNIHSCTKDNNITQDFSSQTSQSNLRTLDFYHQDDDLLQYIEPNLDELGGIIYDYYHFHQGIRELHELLLPDEVYHLYQPKLDSIQGLYGDLSTEEMLDIVSNEGLLTEEGKLFALSLMEEYKMANDKNAFVNSKLDYIANMNTPAVERSILKIAVVGVHALYKHFMDLKLEAMSVDSMGNRNNIELREDECEIDYDAIWFAFGDGFVRGLIGGGVIFLKDAIFKGLKKAIRNFSLKQSIVGSIIGGILNGSWSAFKEWKKEKKNYDFCIECLVLGHSRELSHLCDGSAYYTPRVGNRAFSIDWDNLNAIPKHKTTVPGESLLITQINPVPNIGLVWTSNCLRDHKKTRLVNGIKDHIYNAQIEVPNGDLNMTGQAVFEFGVAEDENCSSYYHEETVQYNLGGLAFSWPELSLSSIRAVKNVKSFSRNGRLLTVTWRIDCQYWDEFYQNKETQGVLEMTTENHCPDGHTKTHRLVVSIRQSLDQEK